MLVFEPLAPVPIGRPDGRTPVGCPSDVGRPVIPRPLNGLKSGLPLSCPCWPSPCSPFWWPLPSPSSSDPDGWDADVGDGSPKEDGNPVRPRLANGFPFWVRVELSVEVPSVVGRGTIIGSVLELLEEGSRKDFEELRVGEGSLCGSRPPDRSGSSNGQPVCCGFPPSGRVWSALDLVSSPSSLVCSPVCPVRSEECGVGRTIEVGSEPDEGALAEVVSSLTELRFELDLGVGNTMLSRSPRDVPSVESSGRPC